MISVSITTESGFQFWNKKQSKNKPIEDLKESIYRELLRTGSQIKGVVVVCSGDLVDTFTFEDEVWVDNEINYQQKILVKETIKDAPQPTPEEIISSQRKVAYYKQTDPLLNEARMKRLLGEDDQADALEIEALKLRISIQEKHPYVYEEE